ncbi:MAG: DinB family protein [Leptospiraceae bacterium]|nr:DinB family protein [Leptospiraceae bacterium]MCP5497287.1 DinB family protein [Leptospiraceae bacterium]
MEKIEKISDLKNRFHTGVEKLSSSTEELTKEEILAHPIVGKWSIQECVCHIVDFESVIHERMKRIIALDNPLLLGADENRFAERLFYNNRNIQEEIQLYKYLRLQMFPILDNLSNSDYDRTGVHNEAGKVTLLDMLERACVHTEHHWRFIQEKRKALGK